tara:strand:+ start:3302 stop:3490 length:189 start_codon:yes stop_codon:yes gene_type:complete
MHKKEYNLGFPYEVSINIEVDEGANFLEVSGDNCNVIKDLIKSALYDIDDVTITKCEVIKHD